MSIIKRNKFIFIIGCEGCGHHGLEPVLKTAIINSGAKLYYKWDLLRDIFNELWYSKRQIKEKAKLVLERINNAFILESNSFPSGVNRSVDKQWDLVEMTELIQPYAKIHYLVLFRDPIAMAFSHDESGAELRNHAKVIADFLEYLNSKLTRIDSKLFKVINYEDLLDRQEDLVSPLARFLGLSNQDIQAGLKHIRRGKKDWKVQMSLEDKQRMVKFFDSSRYPIFIDPAYNILNKAAM